MLNYKNILVKNVPKKYYFTHVEIVFLLLLFMNIIIYEQEGA